MSEKNGNLKKEESEPSTDYKLTISSEGEDADVMLDKKTKFRKLKNSQESDSSQDISQKFENSEKLTCWPFFIDFFSLFLQNIAWKIYTKQTTILLAFTNHKYKNDDNLTTAIGTVNNLKSTILQPLLSPTTEMIEIFGTAENGSNNEHSFGRIMNQSRFIGNIVILIIWFIFQLLKTQIFKIWNLDETQIKLCVILMNFYLVSKFFNYESSLMMRYFSIKGYKITGLVILLITICLAPLFCYIFITVFDLYIYGCGAYYITVQALPLLPVYIITFIFIYDLKTSVLPYLKIFTNMCEYLKILGIMAVIGFLENAIEISINFFANFFTRGEYSASINAINLYNLINLTEQALKSTSKILLSKHISSTNLLVNNTKIAFFYLIIISYTLSILENSMYCIFSSNIVSILVYDKGQMHKKTLYMFKWIILANFFKNLSAVFNSTLKCIGYLKTAMILKIIAAILNFLIIYLFAFKLSFKANGIFIGYTINNLIFLIVLILLFTFYVKFPQPNNNSLESERTVNLPQFEINNQIDITQKYYKEE